MLSFNTLLISYKNMVSPRSQSPTDKPEEHHSVKENPEITGKSIQMEQNGQMKYEEEERKGGDRQESVEGEERRRKDSRSASVSERMGRRVRRSPPSQSGGSGSPRRRSDSRSRGRMSPQERDKPEEVFT